jgi:hypothetical protein
MARWLYQQFVEPLHDAGPTATAGVAEWAQPASRPIRAAARSVALLLLASTTFIVLPVAAADAAAQGDSGTVQPTKVVQYESVVGPVSIPAVQELVPDYKVPVYPDRIPRSKQAPEGFTVEPYFVPDVTEPVTANSWTPNYPDRYRRNVFPTAQQQTLAWDSDKSVFASNAALFGDSGQLYPNRVVQYATLTGPTSVPAAAFAVFWNPVCPDRHTYRRTVEYKPYTQPEFVPDVTQPVAGIEWNPVYPERATRKNVPTAHNRSLFWNTDTPAAPVTVQHWAPIYPDRLVYRRPSDLSASFAPNFVPDVTQPVAGVGWNAIYPSRLGRKHRLAAYVWAQPHFGVEVDVPVMSWDGYTNLYPSKVYKKYRLQQVLNPQPLDPNTFTVSAPTGDPITFGDSGQINGTLLVQYSFYTAPVGFTPPAPFDPQYHPRGTWPNYVFGKRIHVSEMPSWWMDGFDPPAPFDSQYSPRGSYPTVIFRKKIHPSQVPFWSMDRFDAPTSIPPNETVAFGNTGGIAGSKVIHYTAITGPVNAFNDPPPPPFDPQYFPWSVYPNRLYRKYNRGTYQQYQPLFGVIVDVPVMSWESYTSLYPSRLSRVKRVQPVLSVIPLDPTTFVPPFDPQYSPRLVFPDRLHRRVLRPLGTSVSPIEPPPFDSQYKIYPVFPDRLHRKVNRTESGIAVEPFIRNYVLTCDTGVYLINGQDAILTWSGLVGGGTNSRITFRLLIQDDDYHEDIFE